MSEHVSKYEILKQFTIKNPEQVESYLREFPSLEAVLQVAYEQIQAHFPASEIELKVVFHYEVPELTTLFIYIWASMEIDEAWTRLRALEDAWYLDLPQKIQEKFNIDVR